MSEMALSLPFTVCPFFSFTTNSSPGGTAFRIDHSFGADAP
jgi:hypothetical protein